MIAVWALASVLLAIACVMVLSVFLAEKQNAGAVVWLLAAAMISLSLLLMWLGR